MVYLRCPCCGSYRSEVLDGYRGPVTDEGESFKDFYKCLDCRCEYTVFTQFRPGGYTVEVSVESTDMSAPKDKMFGRIQRNKVRR